MAKQKCPPCPAVAKWMTTFSDMSTLLLTFFVLLLTMANFDETKIIEALDSFFDGGQSFFDMESPRMNPQLIQQQSQSAQSRAQQEMQRSMDEYINESNLHQQVSIVSTDTGFSIRIVDSMLFNSGSYEILPDARPLLDKIAAMAADSSYSINIEGHTDDVAGRTEHLNWDLSGNRAMAVLKYFIGRSVRPQSLSATGFGEYHPLLPNITEENRASNRRVEINFVDPRMAESRENAMELPQ